MRAAIATGYRKGFNTIIDANVVTAITAFVLFAVATGGVRGFALMLLIGTILSMLTAVARDARPPRRPRRLPLVRQPELHGREGAEDPALAADRLHRQDAPLVRDLGHDPRDRHRLARRPGPQPRHRLPGRQPGRLHDVAAGAARQRCGARSATSSARTPSSRAAATRSDGGYESFQIKTESLDGQTQTELQRAIETQFGAESIGVRNVSASFSSQILRGAILAIIVSLRADRRLHHPALRVEVRRPGAHRALPRPAARDRRLLARRDGR